MSATRESLEQNYSRKSDEVLLDMHAQGGYTDMAYEVLEEQLRDRGIAVPQRPPEPEPAPKTLPFAGKSAWVSGGLGGGSSGAVDRTTEMMAGDFSTRAVGTPPPSESGWREAMLSSMARWMTFRSEADGNAERQIETV